MKMVWGWEIIIDADIVDGNETVYGELVDEAG